jgi:hypothetical protein
MKTGTKSLLFGVHQFLWHPLTVLIAWHHLYGRPSWRELVCIIIHDWGYWGSPNMDGDEGERHPEWAAKVANQLFGKKYHDLCLYHSRHYARRLNAEPSLLCWADKLSSIYEPMWFYLLRARLSGELAEYRKLASAYIPLSSSDQKWFQWVQERLIKIANDRRGDAVPYINPFTKDEFEK